MNRTEIEIGKTYVGKGGRRRRVVDEGYVAYSGQIDRDTVAYVDPNAGVTARLKSMTRTAFAAWACSVERDQTR